MNVLLLGTFMFLPAFQRAHANGLDYFLGNGIPEIEPKNYDLVIGKLNQQILQNSTNHVPYLFRARINLQKGKFDEVIADSNILISLTNNPLGFVFRGCGYYGEKNYEKAIADFGKCIQIKPDRWVYLLRAGAYQDEQKYDEAISDLTAAINLKQNDAVAYLVRSDCYAENGDLDKAISDLDFAIRISPNYATAYSNRGLLRSRKGDYDKAIADCNRGLLCDSKNAGVYNNLAWLLSVAPEAYMRDGQRALLYAQRACELTEWKNPHCIGTLAVAYGETGDFEAAMKWEKKCMECGLPEKELKQAKHELELFNQKKPYHAQK